MPQPNSTFQRNVTFVSPDLGDILFFEYATFSRENFSDLEDHPRYSYGSPHPDPSKFPHHELVYISHDPDYDARGGQDSKRCRVYYARVRDDQDEYNFEFSSTSIGGQDYSAVQRTYIIKREEFSESSPAIGDPMPTGPDGKFPVGYVLAERTQRRIGSKELDSLYVVEQRIYLRVEVSTTVQTDPFFGGPLTTTRTLFYRGQDYNGAPIEDQVENSALWGLGPSGIKTEVRQLSDDWWEVVSEDVVPQTVNGAVRSYIEYRNYSWPAIISAASFRFISADRRDGTTLTRVSVNPDKESYSGTTRMDVTQVWSSTPRSPSSPLVFDTQSASYSGVQFSTGFSNALVAGLSLIHI